MAELWDVDSGRTLQRWPLPEGMMDAMEFPSSQELILSRLESRDGKRTPFDNRDPANPNVFRVRNLLAPPGKQVLREISGFEGRIGTAGLDPDGRKLTVLGSSSLDGNSPMKLAVIDLRTGQSLWSRSMDPHVEVSAGPSATTIAWRVPGQDGMTLLDSLNRQGRWLLETRVDRPSSWAAGALRRPISIHCRPHPLGQRGFSLRRGEGEVLFNFSFGRILEKRRRAISQPTAGISSGATGMAPSPSANWKRSGSSSIASAWAGRKHRNRSQRNVTERSRRRGPMFEFFFAASLTRI